jgi:hypothetical protein
MFKLCLIAVIHDRSFPPLPSAAKAATDTHRNFACRDGFDFQWKI